MACPLPRATEIALLPIPISTPIADSSTPAGTAWQNMLAVLLDLTPCIATYWGRELTPEGKEGGVVWLLVDWTSIAAHERFALDPAYATIAEPIVALTTSPPVMHHGQFSPCDPSRGNLAPFVPDMSTGVSKGGVTELLYFYVWCKGERGGESEVMKRAETVRRGAEGAAGYMASVSGWVKEEVAVELLPREAESEEEKERFKVLVVAVAWEEVESWRVWRETKDGGEEVERVAMKVVRKCVRFCDARSKEGK